MQSLEVSKCGYIMAGAIESMADLTQLTALHAGGHFRLMGDISGDFLHDLDISVALGVL